MLAILNVVTVVHSLVALGDRKPSVGVLSQLVYLTMPLSILLVSVGLYLPEMTTHILTHFGIGGLPYIQN
jgi:hypothetical protein